VQPDPTIKAEKHACLKLLAQLTYLINW